MVVRHDEDGDRRTSAQFTLNNPDEVQEFLRRGGSWLAYEQQTSNEAWTLTFEGYDPHQEKLREALCTVGNGYFATRGAAPESKAGQVHYPGTYAAGVYNRLDDVIAGTTTGHESLVNLPNWLPLTFRIDGGDWFDVDAVELLAYRQVLDIRGAVLTRELRFRDDAGRTTSVTQHRFVAMHVAHVAALEDDDHRRGLVWNTRGPFYARWQRRQLFGGALPRAGQHPPDIADHACAVAELGADGG